MIKEDYVSYEIAKLLKEKGFDEPTTFVWYEYLPISLDCQGLVNKKARDYFYYNETTERNSSYRNSNNKPKYIHGDIFSCPTHQLAMKWLRDVYDICIVITPNFDTNGNIIYIPTIFKQGFYNGRPNNAYSDSYPEAVNFAIMWVLKEML